ncbi:hypothetical protein DdX_20161 [Ditylenchus destructor]|uniref:Uncharacterized protein n=1 Tax=Ditylenchus destructor TaxID=166010 RepID=A0AAD4MHN2_9BILA|nr:hypothetical protein DdX_20161 [Ditylenchus destructor]
MHRIRWTFVPLTGRTFITPEKFEFFVTISAEWYAETCSENVDQESALKTDSVREVEKRKQSQPGDNMPRVTYEEAEGTEPSSFRKSSPSPHFMSESNTIEEVMERTKPTSKALFEKVEPVKENVGHYQNLAKKVNHVSEREPNRIKKVMLGLESAVYSIMSMSVQKPTENGDIEMDGVNEVTKFLKQTTSNFLESKHGMPHIGHFQARVRTIRSLIQACLTYQLFQIRSQQAQNNYDQDPNSAHQQLRKKTFNGKEPTGNSSITTLSPAASTLRSNKSISSKEMVCDSSLVHFCFSSTFLISLNFYWVKCQNNAQI